MRAIKSTTFRQHLATYLTEVADQSQPLLITTPAAKNDVVVLSLTEYESLIETAKQQLNDDTNPVSD